MCDDIPKGNFPQAIATAKCGFSGKIKFATDGTMQMHSAEKYFKVAFKNSHSINPFKRGHIAFRMDNLKAFLELCDEHDIPYSNYGNTFSKEWYQVFFQDPADNIIEVHQEASG